MSEAFPKSASITAAEGMVPAERETKKKKRFDPVSYTEAARRSYVRIGEELKAQGVDVGALPGEVFAPANTTIENLYSLSKSYETETDPQKKKNIAARMRRAKANLEGHVVAGIEEKVQDLQTTEEIRARMAVPAGPLLAHDVGITSAPRSLAEELVAQDRSLDQRLREKRAGVSTPRVEEKKTLEE